MLNRNILATMAFGLMLGACGDGGGDDTSWLFPLWVPTDVKTIDIDGDGLLDVITIAQLSTSMSQSEGQLVVRRQSSPGVFSAPQTYVVGVYPWRLAVADIDDDGTPDLVVADVGDSAARSNSGSVWLLKQNPASRGVFLPAQRLLDTTAKPYGVAIGDVNGDGAPDLVLTSSTSTTPGATVLVQDTTQRGTFHTPQPITLPGVATAVTLGDLNHDGRDDMVFRVNLSVVNGASTSVPGVLYQQPGGGLAPWVGLASSKTGGNSQLLTVTDLNGDGVADIFESFTPCCDGYQAHITTLLQAVAGGSFSAVDSSLAGINGNDGAVVADLDGNGRPDVATVGFYPVGSPSTVLSNVNILLQDGSGVFHLTQSPAMPISASRVAAGDINDDGLTDLVVLGSKNQVLVLLQSGTTPGTFLTPTMLN